VRSGEPPAFLTSGRVRWGPYRSTDAEGWQGVFFLRCPETGRTLRVSASDGRDWKEANLPGEPWERVSVSLTQNDRKCPSWPEMAWVRHLFWGPEETVMQVHVPEAEHVNYHLGCLHLWKPVGVDIPLPPSICVGPKDAAEAGRLVEAGL